MNDWYYYPEIRLNIEDSRRLLYWNNQEDWEFACEKLEAIIPVFLNWEGGRRIEFIHRNFLSSHNTMITWYGLGGTLSFNGEFKADFKKVPQQFHPLGKWDNNRHKAAFWQLTETLGIYQRMYLTIGEQ